MSERDSLKQILINLMKNASEAMTKGGNLYLKTRHRGTPQEEIESRGFVEVTVGDDGPGIPDKMKKRIFEPFVSSKGGGHSGLGLSIVLNLIKGLNGSIVCQSEEGKGTRFKIELPVGK
jgi:signal transduction histidine kinase